MEKIILVRYGEIYLKGKNRKFFEKTLENNIKNVVLNFDAVVSRVPGRYLISGFEESKTKKLLKAIGKIAGVHSYCLGYSINSNLENIKNVSLEIASSFSSTFKVVTNRADKTFAINSMELSKEIGGEILKNFGRFLKVDIHEPKHILNIDIRENGKTYLFDSENNFIGVGGMPVSSSGHGLMLLSGGIDSPVALYLMNKRGVKIHAIHFHSYPYTSELAKEKVLDLAKELAPFNGGEIAVYLCNVANIQESIHKNCNPDYMITLLRRAMFRIAERLAKEKKFSMLVTGENLGQVASQTIESMTVVENVVEDTVVIRPLICYDKTETIDIARKIETFDISVKPYEDCCTVFLPDSPVTRPRLEKVEFEESKYPYHELIDESYKTIEKVVIK